MKVQYRCADRVVCVNDPNATLLEISWANEIPHMRECGGGGRCTTCRVRIVDGGDYVTPRTRSEVDMARSRGWDDSLAGASVLVSLSNDGWYGGRGGAEQHLAQSVFRAIETGLPLLRATTTGISAIILPDGSVSSRLGEHEAGVLRGTVPAGRHEPTLYTRVGDVFAMSCGVALIASSFAGRRRPGVDGGEASEQPSLNRRRSRSLALRSLGSRSAG